uniref:Uncharacterized protein n=1 Tax=Anguilla anguilla TaxID=7936 RepID=A0A0E9QHB7_ANGAN
MTTRHHPSIYALLPSNMPSQTFSLIPATVLPCNIPKTLFGFFFPSPPYLVC